MADKIVQLADKDGNNLYPVVGADIPKITMTATDPGEGSALAANNYVAVYGGDPIIMDYSTSEVNTGAKWVDGSAIYKKSINMGTLPDNSQKSVAHGISNLATIIKMEGAYRNGSYTFPINSPPASSNNSSVIRTIVNGGNIVIYTGIDRSDLSGYVTLYYTKSS